jgi:hypothetical protein
MVHAGDSDPNTLSRHYMPTDDAGGQNTYLGDQERTIVSDLFRGLSVTRNPNLWQCPLQRSKMSLGTPKNAAL